VTELRSSIASRFSNPTSGYNGRKKRKKGGGGNSGSTLINSLMRKPRRRRKGKKRNRLNDVPFRRLAPKAIASPRVFTFSKRKKRRRGGTVRKRRSRNIAVRPQVPLPVDREEVGGGGGKEQHEGWVSKRPIRARRRPARDALTNPRDGKGGGGGGGKRVLHHCSSCSFRQESPRQSLRHPTRSEPGRGRRRTPTIIEVCQTASTTIRSICRRTSIFPPSLAEGRRDEGRKEGKAPMVLNLEGTTYEDADQCQILARFLVMVSLPASRRRRKEE